MNDFVSMMSVQSGETRGRGVILAVIIMDETMHQDSKLRALQLD